MRQLFSLLAIAVIVIWVSPVHGAQVLHMYSALDTAETQLYIPEFES